MAKKKQVNQIPRPVKSLKETILNSTKYLFCTEPTRFFQVGELVKSSTGHTPGFKILENLFEGKFYKVESLNTGDVSAEPWYELFPIETKAPEFYEKDTVKFQTSQRELGCLLYYFYDQGINLNPDYQRDLVWDASDKEKLLDSIFSGCKIGLFLLRELPILDGTSVGFEIVDGKQRLSTIIEFVEDKISYKGYKWSELQVTDRRAFKRHLIDVGMLKDYSEKDIYKIFLKVNNTGKPIDLNHLEKVKQLLEKGN